MARTLYICYFGLWEPLVQTQVLPYLRELLKDGHEISLLTFEPEFAKRWTAGEIAEEKRRLGDAGIAWYCFPYHRRPSALATAYDIFRGAWFVRGKIREKGLDVLHGRVHVPTLMGALGRKLSGRKPKLLFDIRGFFPEEYTEAGVWPEGGLLYRVAKRVERWLLKEADAFVVLTEKARSILFPGSNGNGSDKLGRPIEVIPTCVDLGKFPVFDGDLRNQVRDELGAGERRMIVYLGSFSGSYMAAEMIDLFAVARDADPRTFFLVLTQRDKGIVKDALSQRGFDDADFAVLSVAPSEVHRYVSAADVALSFIKAGYSKQATSPTKIAEYLACGLPFVANPGVGDLDELVTRSRVGVLIDEFSPAAYERALKACTELGDVRETCRAIAEREFNLETVGGERYRRLYNRILINGDG